VGIAQYLLLALTGYALFAFAIRFVSRGVATTAAVLTVLYPPLVFMAPLYTDNLLSCLLAVVVGWGVATLATGSGEQGTWRYSALGAGVGLLNLVRPSFLLLIPVFLVVLCWNMDLRTAARKGGAFLLVCAALIMPWVIRNTSLAGEFVNIHSGAGWGTPTSAMQYAGEIDNRLLRSDWDLVIAVFNRRTRDAEAVVTAAFPAQTAENERRFLARVESKRDRMLRADGLRKLAELGPRQIASGMPRRMFWLWSTANVSPWQEGIGRRLHQAVHVFGATLVLVGVVAHRRELRNELLIWLYPVYLTAVHLVFVHVESRYTIHGRLFLLVYAAVGLHRLVETARDLIARRVTGTA
jgi:4-amino-4-deoxy-L-arabinose transferase-like glycosyltransferase